MIQAGLPVWLDPGIYQTLDCGCTLYVVEIDPAGMRLALIDNPGKCKRTEHTGDEFQPIRVAA